MTRFAHATAAVLLAAACLAIVPTWAQTPETLDAVSEEIDLLRQLNNYGFTVDQLKGLAAVLEDAQAKRKALADYKQSDAALGPMRALRDALLKGEPTDEQEAAVQDVWDRLGELDAAVEEATLEAAKQLAALLTDDQLVQLNQGEDAAYEQADTIFADLESAREFNEQTYAAWRDRVARETAFRAAGEGEEKGKAVQAKVAAFLDKARALNGDEFAEQSDDLFDELTDILAEAQPKPIREIAESRAAEQLEYLVRSERLPGVIDAQIKAQGG
jgi:hypothetical protein